MKERPILFSAPMVRVILDGSKTQTRRVCKPANENALSYVVGPFEERPDLKEGLFGDEDGDLTFQCPYGQPGDRLWVRETFALDDNGHNEWPVYRADGAALPVLPHTRNPARWVPSIHMPRWASRILLEIVSVRVERLNDIGDADATAEGIKGRKVRSGRTPAPVTVYGLGTDDDWCATATHAFQVLWEDINGAGSWDANPWVWVVEFKRIEP